MLLDSFKSNKFQFADFGNYLNKRSVNFQNQYY